MNELMVAEQELNINLDILVKPFYEAFNKAVTDEFNIDNKECIMYDFVSADIFISLERQFPELMKLEEVQYAIDDEFRIASIEYEKTKELYNVNN